MEIAQYLGDEPGQAIPLDLDNKPTLLHLDDNERRPSKPERGFPEKSTLNHLDSNVVNDMNDFDTREKKTARTETAIG